MVTRNPIVVTVRREEVVASPTPNGKSDERASPTALALMAEGLSDGGVAERLVVTPKTVETHVRHVFAKPSRARAR